MMIDGIMLLLAFPVFLFSVVFLPLAVAARVKDSMKGDGGTAMSLLAGLITFFIVAYVWCQLLSSGPSAPWGVGPT